MSICNGVRRSKDATNHQLQGAEVGATLFNQAQDDEEVAHNWVHYNMIGTNRRSPRATSKLEAMSGSDRELIACA